VPLLIRLQSSGGPGVYALVGPSVNFNTSAKLVDEGDDPMTDIKDEIESVEPAWWSASGRRCRSFW